MKTFPALLALTATLSLACSSGARAEDGVFAEAFPVPARGHLLTIPQGVVGTAETALAVGAAKLVDEEAESEIRRLERKQYGGPDYRLTATHMAEVDEPRLARFMALKRGELELERRVQANSASAEDRESLAVLSKKLAAMPEAARAEALIDHEIERQIKTGFFGGRQYGDPEAAGATRVRTFKAAAKAGLLVVVADGALRIVEALSGRNPGFSPVVNLSRAAIKHRLAPVPAEKVISADATMSAN